MNKQDQDKWVVWRDSFIGYYKAVTGDLPSKWTVADVMDSPYMAGVSPITAAARELEDCGYEGAEIDTKLDAYIESLTLSHGVTA